MDMYESLVSLGLLAFGISLYRFLVSRFSSLPPGPLSLPIVGALFSLKQPLHQHLTQLGKRYGPFTYLKIGMVPYLIVNDAQAAEKVLKVHDAEFADRPNASEYFRLLSFGWKDMVFSPCSKTWRIMRKICTVHLFSNRMLDLSAEYRRSSFHIGCKSILQAFAGGEAINLRDVLGEIISTSLCHTLFSKRAPKVVELVDNVAAASLNLNVGELIPALDWLDLHGINARVRDEILPPLKSMLEEIIDEHRQKKAEAGDEFIAKDFVDVLISMEKEDALEDISIVALLVEMIFGGLHTTKETLEWAMAELVNNPDKMLKAQQELDEVIGKDRLVDEGDLPKLSYIQAVVKETLRSHPVGPLGLPHLNPKDVKLDGYHIPAGTRVLINIWGIGRDEKYWKAADAFLPERFIDSKVSPTGQHFQLIPFGAGRRMCVGYGLALRSIAFFLAALLQGFEWHPKGEISLMEDKGKISCSLASHMLFDCLPRVKVDLL